MLDHQAPALEPEEGLRGAAEVHDQRSGSRLAELERQAERNIATWLGIAPEGVFVYRVSPWAGRALLVAGVALVLMVALARAGGAALSAVQLILIGAALAASADTIRADVHGLSIRKGTRRQTLAWSEIRSLEGSGQFVRVRTDRGEFRLSRNVRGGAALLACLRNVVAARAAGMILPAEVPLPEGALSPALGRVEPGQVARGLSRSEP